MFLREKQIFKAIGKLELRPTKSGEKFYVMKSQKNLNWERTSIHFKLNGINVSIDEMNGDLTLLEVDSNGQFIKDEKNNYVKKSFKQGEKIDETKYRVRETRSIGTSTKEFKTNYPYEWVQHITKNLDSLLKSDVEVEGEIEYEFYNGNIVRKYKIKNIKILKGTNKPLFLVTETLAYERSSLHLVDGLGKIFYYLPYNFTYSDKVFIKVKTPLLATNDEYSDGLFKGLDVIEGYFEELNKSYKGLIRVSYKLSKEEETSNEFDLNSLDITTRKLYDSCNEDMKKKILERVKNYVSINKNNNTKYELYMFHINEDTSIYETIVDNDFIIGVGQKIENELKNKRNDKKYKLELKKIIDNTSNEEYEFETPSNDDEDMTDFSSSLENKTVDVENTSTPTNKHINSDMYDEDNDEDEDDDDPFDWN